jgi:hypothetical protein
MSVAAFETSPVGHTRVDTQESNVGGGTKPETGAIAATIPTRVPRPSLFDPTLYVFAQFLDDIEGLRKAQGNRKRILTAGAPDEDGATKTDADGQVRGFGLDSTHPVVSTIEALSAQLDAVEHQAILALNRAMRRHPLVFWQRSAKGVGEKQLARLLAATGDPYINATTGRPRTVSQLWAYCGLHTLPTTDQRTRDTQTVCVGGGGILPAGAKKRPAPTRWAPLPGTNVAARRHKGIRCNWSTDAKTRAYLIATSCIKHDGTYREVYDARRAHTAVTHPDWTPGHSHNDALRILSKTILRDLWRAGRDYHEGNTP